MKSVNDKTTGAIKLTRADAVKLVAAELSTVYADEIERGEAAVQAAREDLHREVEARAWRENDAMLEPVVGERPCTQVVYRAYEDGTDDGDQADVVFSDSPRSYEARNRVTVRVPVNEDLRSAWHLALAQLRNARERDTRVSAMKKEARETLIKTALDECPEGGELVLALKAFSAAVRARLEGHHHTEDQGPACKTTTATSTKTPSCD